MFRETPPEAAPGLFLDVHEDGHDANGNTVGDVGLAELPTSVEVSVNKGCLYGGHQHRDHNVLGSIVMQTLDRKPEHVRLAA